MTDTAAAPPPPTVLWRELALLFCLAALWGSSYFWVKIAVAEIPPITLIAIRTGIAAVFLLLVAAASGARPPRGGKLWGQLFIQSCLNASVAWSLLAWGQQFVDSAVASVLNSTSPLWVFLFTAALTRHEPTTGRRFLGAALGVLGVALIIGPEALKGLGQGVAGQAAAVLGAMLYAGAAIYGTRFSALPAIVTAASVMSCAALTLIPASLLLEQPWRLRPSLEAVLAASILGLLCTGVAMMLYFRLLRTLGSLGVASQAYLRAGVGVALGVTFLGETLTATVAFGILAAVIGVALINWPSRKVG